MSGTSSFSRFSTKKGVEDGEQTSAQVGGAAKYKNSSAAAEIDCGSVSEVAAGNQNWWAEVVGCQEPLGVLTWAWSSDVAP